MLNSQPEHLFSVILGSDHNTFHKPPCIGVTLLNVQKRAHLMARLTTPNTLLG